MGGGMLPSSGREGEMEYLDAASGVTQMTVAVLESAGMLIVSLALAASVAVSFGIGRLVERASRSSTKEPTIRR